MEDNSENKSKFLNEIEVFNKGISHWNSNEITQFLNKLKREHGKEKLIGLLNECLGNKELYFVRHAQSIFNKWRTDSFFNFSWFYRNTPENRDPIITELGYSQCEETRKGLELIPDIIYCSPLSRACLTTLQIFGNKSKIVSSELLRENMDTPCDLGTPKSKLNSKFPGIDFSNLKTEFWWGVPPTQDDPYKFVREGQKSTEHRIMAFLILMCGERSKKIALVSHSILYRTLVSNFPALVTPMRNAEIRRINNEVLQSFFRRVL